jgi:hypothetical protein
MYGGGMSDDEVMAVVCTEMAAIVRAWQLIGLGFQTPIPRLPEWLNL